MAPYARVEAYFGLLDAVKNRYVAQDIQRTKQPLYAV